MPAAKQELDVTGLLLDWNAGRAGARDQLLRAVYDELHRIAGRHLATEDAGHTLQATALVNEAYLRLVDQTRVHWRNRAHFFAISSQLMRRILVDHARRRRAAKRGGHTVTIAFDDAIAASGSRRFDLVDLDDTLEALADIDPAAARLVELRFFGGLTIAETAEVLGISPASVKREWTTARAWLHRELTMGAAR